MMLNGEAEIYIPGRNSVLYLENTGKDHLVILYSDRKIRARYIRQLCLELKEKKGNLVEALYQALGDFQVPRGDIDYHPTRMNFRSSTRSEGSIIPLVLEVEVE